MMKKENLKVFMHAQIVCDIVKDKCHQIDEEKFLDEAYKLMIENDGYDIEHIIEIMLEKAQEEQECSEEFEEWNSTVDPAFASWEDCNRQFV